MKVVDLLSEESSPFDLIKQMSLDFKAHAKELDLTIVHGMGWPVINNDGAWFGGGLGPRGGYGREERRDTLVDADIRRKAFLQYLAKKLEALKAEGRVIKIARGSSRTDKTKIITPAAGEIMQALQKNTIDDYPPGNTRKELMPCVTWFISNPVEMAGKIACTFNLTLRQPNADPNKQSWQGTSHTIMTGGSLDIKLAQKFDKEVAAFQQSTVQKYSGEPAINRKATARHTEFISSVVDYMEKNLGIDVTLHDNLIYDQCYFGVSRKVTSRKAIPLSSEQFLDFIAFIHRLISSI